MQDRIPENPGRVLITPENGSTAYYATMTRADNPTQEGTPLNKSSLLKDATAALFGLGADAVPNDVFGVLSRFQSGLGNEYVWAKSQSKKVLKPSGSTDTAYAPFVSTASTQTTLKVYPSYTISEDGTVALTGGAVNITGTYNSPPTSAQVQAYAGYYVYSYDGNSILQLTSNSWTTNVQSGATYGWSVGSCNKLGAESEMTVISYVNSPDHNAYPVDDGYTYTALGQLGAKVQIATGSYTGTGGVGSENANVITLDFVPKVVMVGAGAYDSGGVRFMFSWDTANSYELTPYIKTGNTLFIRKTSLTITFAENFSWYTEGYNSPSNQLNKSGCTYYWIAIG